MTITDQQTSTPSPPPTRDVLLDQMEDLIASAKVHAEGLIDDLRSWSQLMLGATPDPGHGLTPASRVKRGQQLVHEDGWWNVVDIAVDATGVALQLQRIGHKPLSLLVDHDATFETAEPF